jgi:hypothetical protein
MSTTAGEAEQQQEHGPDSPRLPTGVSGGRLRGRRLAPVELVCCSGYPINSAGGPQRHVNVSPGGPDAAT